MVPASGLQERAYSKVRIRARCLILTWPFMTLKTFPPLLLNHGQCLLNDAPGSQCPRTGQVCPITVT